jgi:molybdopterin-binding protein
MRISARSVLKGKVVEIEKPRTAAQARIDTGDRPARRGSALRERVP